VNQDASEPMRMRLSEERREILINAIQQLFVKEFERELSVFQASRLIDFFLGQLGPPVYNQAIQDARAYIQLKLDDLDGEVYEPEEPV
jgi:uncharacterized protein (DUF2164 family)